MDYVSLNPGGPVVSRIGLGLRAIAGEYGPVDSEQARATVRRALDLGVTLFETPDDSAATRLLGDLLPREHAAAVVVLQAPFGLLDRDVTAVRAFVQDAMGRLRRDAIDVLLFADLTAERLMESDALAPLTGLRAEGLVRRVGVSVLYVEQALWAIVQGGVDVLEFPYNPLTSMPGQAVIQPASMRGVGLIARETLGSGLFTGVYGGDTVFHAQDLRSHMPRELVQIRTRVARRLDALQRNGERTLPQAFIRYALDVPQFQTVLVGARTPAQVEEDVRALAVPPLTLEEGQLIRATLDDMAHRHF
jgi:aryl-alcohol dehydrogenase-like predicted oxidoreductase